MLAVESQVSERLRAESNDMTDEHVKDMLLTQRQPAIE